MPHGAPVPGNPHFWSVETTQVWPKMLKWNFETCTVPWIILKNGLNPTPKKTGKKTQWHGKIIQLFDGYRDLMVINNQLISDILDYISWSWIWPFSLPIIRWQGRGDSPGFWMLKLLGKLGHEVTTRSHHKFILRIFGNTLWWTNILPWKITIFSGSSPEGTQLICEMLLNLARRCQVYYLDVGR